MFSFNKKKRRMNKVSHKYDKELMDHPKNISEKSTHKGLFYHVGHFFNRFQLGPHHYMEHAGIKYGIIALVMVITLTWGGFNDHGYHVEQAETLTHYDSSPAFSKSSSITLSLHRLQISGDRHTAYIPFSFSNMTTVSDNANKYTIYVFNPKGGALSYPLVGRLAIFGATSRGALIIHSSKKIANEPIEVVLRNDDHLEISGGSDGGSDTISNVPGIQDFEEKYDALDFKVNPGAFNTKTNHKLGTGDSCNTIYNQLFGRADKKMALSYDAASRRKIKNNLAVANEYSQRLKKLGFQVPKNPAWLNPNWRPYDAIMPNGVPKNQQHKTNAKTVFEDGAYSPVNDNDDRADDVQFPSELKKKDGTTTNATNNNTVSKDESADNAGNDSNNINGGDATSPSQMWTQLQTAWDDILALKHNIYTTNASTLFKIKATVDQQNALTSVGKKKHIKELNLTHHWL